MSKVDEMMDKAKEMAQDVKDKLSSLNKDESGHYKQLLPDKQSTQPGIEATMLNPPQFKAPWYKGSNKLLNKVAIITGGDSGIGRSVAVLYAREGAKIVIVYLDEDEDAKETQDVCEKEEKGQVLLIRSDLRIKKNCIDVINQTIEHYGQIDILVNNIGEQHVHKSIEEIKDEEIQSVFNVKFFSMFWMCQAAIPYLKEGSCIINTSSVTAYEGKPSLVDYSASNGAIVTFTRSLALQLASKKIRVNSVAPGAINTPLIPSTFGKKKCIICSNIW